MPVTGGAADAGALARILFVQHHGDRHVERLVPERGEAVVQGLDARLVTHRGVRVGRARPRFRGVLAARAVHVVEPLGRGVVRLELGIRDRPCGRQPTGMAHLAEVRFAHAQERRAVELGVAAHEIVRAGLELVALAVQPALGVVVAAFEHRRLGAPVLCFTLHVVATLHDQDALAGPGQCPGQRAATGAAADDQDVPVVAHDRAPSAGRWFAPGGPGRCAPGHLAADFSWRP